VVIRNRVGNFYPVEASMKAAWSMLLGLAVVCALVATLQADDKDDVKTLKGKITCAKCDLALDGQKSCATVIQVKEDDKEVIYWFDKDSNKKYHGQICKEAKKGVVKGKVKEKDDKKWVTVTKLEYDSKEEK
jgi:hypothetical protein